MELRVLSYNIQACIGSRHYGDYLYGIRRQFLHDDFKSRNLRKIAEFIADYDLVCLQELDFGGRRSGFESQFEALESISGHRYGLSQSTRKIGRVSFHGNGILSKYPIENFENHKLPGRVAGRGLMICTCNGITFANTHLSVGSKSQEIQLDYIHSALKDRRNIVLAGDFNCSSAGKLSNFAEKADLKLVTGAATKTYPSWKPVRDLDHVMVSMNLRYSNVQVPRILLSDHRPVEVNLG